MTSDLINLFKQLAEEDGYDLASFPDYQFKGFDWERSSPRQIKEWIEASCTKGYTPGREEADKAANRLLQRLENFLRPNSASIPPAATPVVSAYPVPILTNGAEHGRNGSSLAAESLSFLPPASDRASSANGYAAQPVMEPPAPPPVVLEPAIPGNSELADVAAAMRGETPPLSEVERQLASVTPTARRQPLPENIINPPHIGGGPLGHLAAFQKPPPVDNRPYLDEVIVPKPTVDTTPPQLPEGEKFEELFMHSQGQPPSTAPTGTPIDCGLALTDPDIEKKILTPAASHSGGYSGGGWDYGGGYVGSVEKAEKAAPKVAARAEGAAVRAAESWASRVPKIAGAGALALGLGLLARKTPPPERER